MYNEEYEEKIALIEEMGVESEIENDENDCGCSNGCNDCLGISWRDFY